MAISSDTDAIRRCQQGEMDGLEPLMSRYQVAAARLAYLLIGDRSLADDIMQDSFLVAYRHIKRFDPNRPFAPWFFQIVTNVARQRRRDALRRREVSLDALDTADPTALSSEIFTAPRGAQDAPARQADPVLQAERAEERSAVLDALGSLTQKQREAVVLRYYLGYSDREMAAILGCRAGAARVRLHGGLVALARAIQHSYPWLVAGPAPVTPEEVMRHVAPESY